MSDVTVLLADSDGSAGLRLAQVLIVTSNVHYNNNMITYLLRMRWVLIMRCASELR